MGNRHWKTCAWSGALLVAAWLTPASPATASLLYKWEGEGCFVYNPGYYGGDGDGGCGHRITGIIRMPDSYVPGSDYLIDGTGPEEDAPFFYFYLYAWAPFHPEIRGYMTGLGSVRLPETSGPASIFWCNSESCDVLDVRTFGGGFHLSLDEAYFVDGSQHFTLVPTYAPEPGTLAMLGLGLAGLCLGRRKAT